MMKRYLSGSAFAAIAGAAMLSPLAAAPASAQTPGGSYLQTCTDVRTMGDRVVATCRRGDGSWNRTAINNIHNCVGGLANSNGRLVCGTRGGDFNVGSRGRGGDYGRHDGRQWGGYGSSYGPDQRWGQYYGGGGYWGDRDWYGR